MFKVRKFEAHTRRQVSFYPLFPFTRHVKFLTRIVFLPNRYSAGFVFLRFENTQAALAAQRSLHGRWFAGKMITASFMVFTNFLVVLLLLHIPY